jgi:hypothetical protein
MDHDPQRFEINVFDPQHSDLAGSQAVTVGKQKNCLVVSMRSEPVKQACSFLQREKLDRVGAHRWHSRIPRHPEFLLEITLLSNFCFAPTAFL